MICNSLSSHRQALSDASLQHPFPCDFVLTVKDLMHRHGKSISQLLESPNSRISLPRSIFPRYFTSTLAASANRSWVSPRFFLRSLIRLPSCSRISIDPPGLLESMARTHSVKPYIYLYFNKYRHIVHLLRKVKKLESMPAERLTILVVDDEPAIQRLLVAILAPQGYGVLEARHPIHALQLCEHYPDPIHLLLTDVVMPYMNGRELASAALAVRPQMRVLYMSGNEDGLLMQGLDLEEEVFFLQKPFSPSTLLQKVRDVLGDVLGIEG